MTEVSFFWGGGHKSKEEGERRRRRTWMIWNIATEKFIGSVRNEKKTDHTRHKFTKSSFCLNGRRIVTEQNCIARELLVLLPRSCKCLLAVINVFTWGSLFPKLVPWPASQVPIHVSLLYKWFTLTFQNSGYGPQQYRFFSELPYVAFSDVWRPVGQN